MCSAIDEGSLGIAESGQDICATIYKDKVHSLTIFKKMGFSIVGKTYWIESLPVK